MDAVAEALVECGRNAMWIAMWFASRFWDGVGGFRDMQGVDGLFYCAHAPYARALRVVRQVVVGRAGGARGTYRSVF